MAKRLGELLDPHVEYVCNLASGEPVQVEERDRASIRFGHAADSFDYLTSPRGDLPVLAFSRFRNCIRTPLSETADKPRCTTFLVTDLRELRASLSRNLRKRRFRTRRLASQQ